MLGEFVVTYSTIRVLVSALVSVIVALLLTGCAGQTTQQVTEGRSELAPCPSSPNCVSTEEQSSIHSLTAPTLQVTPEAAWPAIVAAVKALPRTTITHQSNYHLRAESRSWIFRFIDDIEIYLDANNNHLAMRSASRWGYSDLGVNARRLKKLIENLESQGILESGTDR